MEKDLFQTQMANNIYAELAKRIDHNRDNISDNSGQRDIRYNAANGAKKQNPKPQNLTTLQKLSTKTKCGIS